MDISQKLKEIILITNEYYGKKISDEVLLMYYHDLCDLDPNELCTAFEEYRKNPDNKFAPLPAQIREMIRPQTTQEMEAREAVSRIVESVSRFGYMRGEEARTYIGELGWRLVTRFSGWAWICENAGTSRFSVPMMFAQMRDLGETLQERERLGIGHLAPQLSPVSNPQMRTLITQAIPKWED